MTSYALLLDDERQVWDIKWIDLPLEDWVIVRSYNDFVAYITMNGLPRVVSFDMDLAAAHYPTDTNYGDEIIDYNAYEVPCGVHCVEWLINYCIANDRKFPQYFIHSLHLAPTKHSHNLIKEAKKKFYL